MACRQVPSAVPAPIECRTGSYRLEARVTSHKSQAYLLLPYRLLNRLEARLVLLCQAACATCPWGC
jgi:hypothetical protein